MFTFEYRPADMHTECDVLSGYNIATLAYHIPPIKTDVSEVANDRVSRYFYCPRLTYVDSRRPPSQR
jgi:hypothetical protein